MAGEGRKRKLLVVTLLGLAGLSCSLLDRVLPGGDSVERMSPDEVAAAVEAFDPVDLDLSLQRLNEAATRGEAGSVAALSSQLEAEAEDQRWAAVYVAALLAETPDDVAVLETALDDPEPILRLMAAASLVGLGHVDSIPILIEGLDSDAEYPYSDPPEPIADLAREALEAYTGQSFAETAAWRAWWDGVGGDLRWNGEAYGVE